MQKKIIFKKGECIVCGVSMKESTDKNLYSSKDQTFPVLGCGQSPEPAPISYAGSATSLHHPAGCFWGEKHPEPAFTGNSVLWRHERHPGDSTQLAGAGTRQSGTGSAVLDAEQESMRTRARAVSICLGFARRGIHGKELQGSTAEGIGRLEALQMKGEGILAVLSTAELVN